MRDGPGIAAMARTTSSRNVGSSDLGNPGCFAIILVEHFVIIWT